LFQVLKAGFGRENCGSSGGQDQTVVRPRVFLARSNAVLAVARNAGRPPARNNAAPLLIVPPSRLVILRSFVLRYATLPIVKPAPSAAVAISHRKRRCSVDDPGGVESHELSKSTGWPGLPLLRSRAQYATELARKFPFLLNGLKWSASSRSAIGLVYRFYFMMLQF
jgi:hypothetical protein